MYLIELLDQLFINTGLRFMAVCSGGAALRKPSDDKAATYAELLEYVPHGLQCVIAILCGNDFLASGWPCGAPQCEAAAKNLCASMKRKAKMVFAITGCSSDTWGYNSWSIDCKRKYDDDARWLAEIFANAGVPAVTGAKQFVGLQIADTIGHVLPASKNNVFQGYHDCVRLCCFPDLPQPWFGMWDSDIAEYYYVNAAKLVGQRLRVQPSVHPPVFVDDNGEEWDPACAVGGDWYYVNRRDSKKISWDYTPESVGDWKVYWDVSEQDWAWKHVVTAEIMLVAPPPLKNRCVRSGYLR